MADPRNVPRPTREKVTAAMATNIANKVKEVRAWMGRKMFQDDKAGVTYGEVEQYINSRWPDLDIEIRNRIYRASL